MKFTSIPDTFSSYREPLLYAFETGSSTPRDVELKIINHTTGEEIGRKRLYNVTSGEVDIAPYLRSAQGRADGRGGDIGNDKSCGRGSGREINPAQLRSSKD